MAVASNITSIESIQDLQHLVQSGWEDWEFYGYVKAIYKGDLILFDYTSKAHFINRWNFFERISRGLILNRKTGEVVARPFDKFFNWGEGGRFTQAPIKQVFDKVDGSLGILYRENGQFKVATRGSFDSEQALWATEYVNSKLRMNYVPEELTLLFEIIYPENRNVVDYGNDKKLVLLAARNRFTGDELSWGQVVALSHSIGATLPAVYRLNRVEDVIEFVNQRPASEAEGCVVLFADGQRFKFKSQAYLHAHRVRHYLSPRLVAESIYDGTLDKILTGLPKNLANEVLDIASEIQQKEASYREFLQSILDQAPKSSQKEFALWVNEHYPEHAPFLFRMHKGQDIRYLFFRREYDARIVE